MMTKTQKAFFITLLVLCSISLIVGVIAAYFAISAFVTLASAAPGDSIGAAVLLVFFILFFLVEGCFFVASVPFCVLGPFRAPRSKGRLLALIMFLVGAALFLANAIMLLIAL